VSARAEHLTDIDQGLTSQMAMAFREAHDSPKPGFSQKPGFFS
jgi:hypothetical protein